MKQASAIPLLLAVACASDAPPEARRDLDAASRLFDALDVQRTVALATDPARVLQLDAGCLAPSEIDASVASTTHTQHWEGPCTLEDGALLEGTLRVTPTPEGHILSAEQFSISEAGEVQVQLSGALELTRIDNLMLLHVSMHACGALGRSCSTNDTTSTVGLDLDYSIHPMDTFPQAYSVGVSGAVDGEESFTSVDGTWQFDQDLCEAEPMTGTMVVDTHPRQSFTLEGSERCDGCLTWQVEGVEVEPLCADDFW